MPPKKKSGSHIRAYTLLKDHMLQDTSAVNQTRDTPLSPLEIENEIGTIVTVQADASLQQFPELIRNQLTEYLSKPGALLKTFAGGQKNFNLYTTTNDQPACFVELDTENRLDAAVYHFGPVLRRSMFVVVKPQPDSNFNNGEPAIITFYGKGMKADERRVISRWAIWTPNGYRDDLLVDRLVIGEASEVSDYEERPTKRRKSSRKIYRKRPSYVPEPSEEDTNEKLFVSEDEDNEPNTALLSQLQNLESNSKAEQTSYQHTEHDTNRDPYQPPIRESTPMVAQINRRSTSDGVFARPSIPHSRSQRLDMPLIDTRSRHSIGASQSLASPALSDPFNIQYPSDGGLSRTMVAFKAIQAGEAYVAKSLAQCNSVQKLFAYACKAGISGTGVIMLSAIVGMKSVEIVRDDDDDFMEFLNLVRQEQESGSSEAVMVTITPCAY